MYLLAVAILLTLLLVSVGLLFAHLSTLRPEPSRQPPTHSIGEIEILNPESTPTKLSLDQAVKAVESIWSLPETTDIRAHLLKDHYFETITWELQWRKNRETVLSAGVEANSGEVLTIFDWVSHQGTEDRLKDPSKAINIALDLLKKLGVPTQNLSEPKVIREEYPGKFAYKVLWLQEHQGVPVLSGNVFVSIDSQNEKPVAFGRRLINTEGIKTER